MGLKEELTEAVESLYSYRDYYYINAPNRQELEEMEAAKAESRKQRDLQERLREVLGKLDANREKLCASKQDTAYFELLRGKALNVVSDFDEDAQQALERAVKCDPELTDAWNQLGECFWKRGDLQQARNCFETALERKRTKDTLRSLSMLLRQVRAAPGTKPNETESQKMLIERSIEFAKEAVSLDVRDGSNWNCLATALVAQFFSFGSQNASLIQRALGAYANAEKDVRVRETAVEMHVNRSVALHYADKYAEALDALREAMRIDPHFHAASSRFAEERSVLRDVHRSITDRGGLKKKRFEQLISTIEENTTINGLRLQVHRKTAARAQPAEEPSVAPLSINDTIPTLPSPQPKLFSIAGSGNSVSQTARSDSASLAALSANLSQNYSTPTPAPTPAPVPAPAPTRELVDVSPVKVADLKDGCNAEKALFCVALSTVRQPNGVPLTICVADCSGKCALVNVYNVDTRKRTVSVGDRLVILEPLAKFIRISESVINDETNGTKNGGDVAKEQNSTDALFEFTLIRVSSPLSLLVNGKPLEPNAIAETEFRIAAQP